MNDNILTSYSFLAALSENQSDIYRAVYVPLFKRAITAYAQQAGYGGEGIQGGINDIQNIINNDYGINVPTIVAQKVLKLAFNSLSKRQRTNAVFEIDEKTNSFIVRNFDLNEYQDAFDKERRNANRLQEEFERFARSNGYENVVPLSDFIGGNTKKLCSFFSGSTHIIDENGELTYMPHIRFLMHIEKTNNDLYHVAERIYLGSIIATFLETGIDLDVKSIEHVAYYLDSKLILCALDLQDELDTQPAKELIKLIRDSGGVIRILDITLNEIHGILTRSFNNFSQVTPVGTVNAACVRCGKSRSELMRINGQLEEIVKREFSANIDVLDSLVKREATASGDIEELREQRINKHNAAHDVYAYFTVRMKRGNRVTFHQKANYWFVTTNTALVRFNALKKEVNTVNEVISIDELTSILFLQNPQRFSRRASSIGLKDLIAQTYSNEIPSKDLLNEFERTVRETVTDLTVKDYEFLFAQMADRSTKEIEHLLMESGSKDEFSQSINSIIAKEKEHRFKEEKDKEQLHKDLEDKTRENEALRKELDEAKDENRKYRKDEDRRKNRQKFIWMLFKLIGIILLIFCLLGLLIWYFVASPSGNGLMSALKRWVDGLDSISTDVYITIITAIWLAVEGGLVKAMCSMWKKVRNSYMTRKNVI